jgi:prophage maintenance system killer protein
VRNHPYVDGNKRTGFVVGIVFLELNGHRFTASEGDATQAVLAFAAGTLDEADTEPSCARTRPDRRVNANGPTQSGGAYRAMYQQLSAG